jgi:hypothetical protein
MHRFINVKLIIITLYISGSLNTVEPCLNSVPSYTLCISSVRRFWLRVRNYHYSVFLGEMWKDTGSFTMFLGEHLKLAVTNWKSSRRNKKERDGMVTPHTYVSHLNVSTFSSSVCERFAVTALIYVDSFTNPFVEFIPFRVGCGDSTVFFFLNDSLMVFTHI